MLTFNFLLLNIPNAKTPEERKVRIVQVLDEIEYNKFKGDLVEEKSHLGSYAAASYTASLRNSDYDKLAEAVLSAADPSNCKITDYNEFNRIDCNMDINLELSLSGDSSNTWTQITDSSSPIRE